MCISNGWTIHLQHHYVYSVRPSIWFLYGVVGSGVARAIACLKSPRYYAVQRFQFFGGAFFLEVAPPPADVECAVASRFLPDSRRWRDTQFHWLKVSFRDAGSRCPAHWPIGRRGSSRRSSVQPCTPRPPSRARASDYRL
ncbi:hypothetical protein D3C71_1779590 [compost metagenome]